MNFLNKNNPLTEFNVGGSHEQNPLGGIPQGMGANGKMNTVEEGETKKDNYVFSDRLKLDENLIKKYNLPKNLKGKTMAEASKKLNESFKETNSKIDRDSTNEMIDRLISASEDLRTSKMSATTPDDKMGQLGGMSNRQNQMFFGGPENAENMTGNSTGSGPGAGAYMAAATGLFDMANTAFGKTGIDTSGRTDVDSSNVKVGGMAASGALKGAQAGMTFGPWGAAIGGVLGGAASLVGGNKAKKEALEAEKNYDLGQNAKYRNTFATGGKLDDKKKKTRPVTDEEAEANSYKNSPDSMFTAEGIKQLGFVNEYDNPQVPELNMGKYKDVNYFKPSMDASGRVILNNTQNNPANAQLYNEQIHNIQKLNPNIQFANNGFIPLSKQNQMDDGGYIRKGFNRKYYDDLVRQGDLSEYDLDNEKSRKQLQQFLGVNDDGLLGRDTFNALKDKYSLRGTGIQSEGMTDMFDGRDRYNNELDFINKGNVRTDLQNLNKNVVDTDFINNKIEDKEKDSFLDKSGEFLKDHYGDILRYAPVATNALQLMNLEKPEQESLSRLDNRYKPDYVDERSLINRASSEYNNVANSLKSATNGSVGALRSNLLAAHLNRQKGLSDSFLQADNINRGENRVAQQFNLNVDGTNLQQSNTEKDLNARNRAAYDNNKSRFISQLGNDLGNIGLEQLRKKYPERMDLLYDYKGKYRNA